MDKKLEFIAAESISLENQDEIAGSSKNFSETMTTENKQSDKAEQFVDFTLLAKTIGEMLRRSEVTGGVGSSTLIANESSDSVDDEEISITLMVYSAASDQELPVTNDTASISIEEIDNIVKGFKPIPTETIQEAQPGDQSVIQIYRQRPCQHPLLVSNGMCIRTFPSFLGNISLYVRKDSSYGEEFQKESPMERVGGVLDQTIPFPCSLNNFVAFLKSAFRFVRRGTYILSTSFCILVLPVLIMRKIAMLEEAT